MSNISLLRLHKERQSFTNDPCEDYTANPVEVNKLSNTKNRMIYFVGISQYVVQKTPNSKQEYTTV